MDYVGVMARRSFAYSIPSYTWSMNRLISWDLFFSTIMFCFFLLSLREDIYNISYQVIRYQLTTSTFRNVRPRQRSVNARCSGGRDDLAVAKPCLKPLRSKSTIVFSIPWLSTTIQAAAAYLRPQNVLGYETHSIGLRKPFS